VPADPRTTDSEGLGSWKNKLLGRWYYSMLCSVVWHRMM
jgi:hypothetical protein